MPVSPRNKKTCALCGMDVTFARRVLDQAGRLLCANCAKASEPPMSGRRLASLASSELEDDDLALLEHLEPAAAESVVTPVKIPVSAARETRPPSPATLWIVGSVVVLGVIAGICFFITRKGWDEQHREQITSMKADAEHLIQSGDPKGAYFKYKDLFAFVEGHTIQDDFIKTELEMAKGGMDTARSEAAPLIAKEEAEQKARQQEQDRLAAEQKAAELALKEKESEQERAREALAKRVKLAGSVQGAAWLVRNNGASDTLRGLHIYVIKRRVKGTRVEEILRGQILYEVNQAREDRASAKLFSTPSYFQSYLDSAGKHDETAAALRTRIAQLDDSMETLSAFNLCDQLAPMMDFSACALSTKLFDGKTDIDGKYRISNIPGGDYYLYANINTKVLSATWLIPITIKGLDVNIDIDNDSAVHLHGG